MSMNVEKRLESIEGYLERILAVMEMNAQALASLHSSQQTSQEQIHSNTIQGAELRSSIADLRSSVMELRGGHALNQGQVLDLHEHMAELIRQQTLLMQVVSQQQEVLVEFRRTSNLTLEHMEYGYSKFQQTISTILEQINKTLQYLFMQAGGSMADLERLTLNPPRSDSSSQEGQSRAEEPAAGVSGSSANPKSKADSVSRDG